MDMDEEAVTGHGAAPQPAVNGSKFSLGAFCRRCDPLVVSLVALTVTTGLVDAVSYIALGHVFVANITGTVVLLGFAAAGVSDLSVTRLLFSLGSFMLGAGLGGRVATAMRADKRRWLLIAGIVEAVAIFVAAAACAAYHVDDAIPAYQVDVVVGLTAFAMGFRTATARRLAVKDVTTTVVTMTLTGLIADSSADGSNSRVWRQIFSVIALIAGAALGAFLLRYGVAVPLVFTGAGVLATTAAYATVFSWPGED
jgi:uncharacterized membrane protein YoaK (UPF0700 family)